jgi:hypothetical protein
MTERATELQEFNKRHGDALARFASGLVKITGGAIIGSVVTAGVYTGVIDPSKLLTSTEFKQSEIVQPHTANIEDLVKNSVPKSNEETKLFDLFGKPSSQDRAKSAKLDIDPDLLGNDRVLIIDASTMTLANSINARANDELEAINVIRKAIEQGEAFQDEKIPGEKKADAIIEALDFAKVAKEFHTASYDSHVFELSSSLPRSIVFTEIVETLNWKRDAVRNAVDATTQLADAIRSEDVEASITLLERLSDIMDNYEMATAVEKAASELSERLEREASESAPSSLDAGSLAPSMREASVESIDKLREHFSLSGGAKERSIWRPSI